MSENTAILLSVREQRQSVLVNQIVAYHTKSNTISSIRSPQWIYCKWEYVMNLQIPATIITAMTACESISRHAIVSPLFVFCRQTHTATLHAFAVNVSTRFITSWCVFTGAKTNLLTSLNRMLFPNSIAWSGFCRCAHLGATLRAHLFSLHRWNKRSTSLFPRLFNNLTPA